MSETSQNLPESPLIALGQVARLRVSDTTAIGAFLDWGLEKELLLPFAEQTRGVSKDELVNVALYLDKSGRPCATMKVYPYLATDSPYLKDAEVEGEIYEISQNFGAFVAVDYIYSGLIPAREIYQELRVGEVVSARVAAVKPDGKLDLALRKKAYLQRGEDAEKILAIIAEQYGGALPFTDKSAAPEDIRQIFGMSKNEFKRALGGLLKEKKIRISKDGVLLSN
ncbi:MAG: S1 RNA-binding domain-containing protein [Lachnospiraceae bacterium]|jgi:predicted RNA-binding protein (virulence factor B family)|nr:S1 RNA-binding domain-containing protein [Lachnospiraceae bacterium]